MDVSKRSDCEHGYRAAGGTSDCPACEADRDVAEYWQGVAIAADEQLRGAVEENERLREGGKQLDGVIQRLVDENEELRDALDRLGGQ